MTHVFHRHLRQTPPVAASSQGMFIRDAEGREYLDASGGAAVSSLGHAHPEVLAAMHAQLDKLAYAHTSFFTSEVAEQLADELITSAPEGMSHVYLVSGGSEAVESALKMARQYFVEIGQPQRTHFIARRQSYHGNTLGALAVGGNAWRREPFAPILVPATHVSPCYPYREQREGESAEHYGLRLAAELEAAIVAQGADRVIAFVAETVGGATAGVLTPVPGYFKAVRAVCDKYGVLLILDEVMCGMGRTGSLHACEQEGVVPDLMTIAKGLGGGYQPIGAVLAQRKIVEAMSKGSGFFQHGHTYLGHPMACAAALAVQQVIRRDGLVARVREDGVAFGAMLAEALGKHAHVGDIRGRGFFWGIELVADRANKTPFDPSLKVNALIKKDAMSRGLLCYPFGGTVDGRQGDHVLLAPPFIATRQDLQEIAERLAASIEAVTRAAVR
ncbi:adenosylmethionine-8-amino-7-oxononanoate aminotransferase [Variovorax boronicumulans]|uniref:Adenosylmethionine-8-amino-7-oxononanoate aminotransferase n=1 Tax=Variovorax boronicumulans TaxID=436515 RepID=A0AAW8CKQ6_9BURK|nr:aspartate aminotransferase family protein [Variovorax boronicumulans]MDP9891943.1 adenosylmethionine-8-amino-7-oxononanoate aminotransferase [Variovorax boronicumulans]MDQ0053116.1 adenosylmethionine-8-amino-7-oxononanoate aminotransferase [Variovorax boronicumulans]